MLTFTDFFNKLNPHLFLQFAVNTLLEILGECIELFRFECLSSGYFRIGHVVQKGLM